MPKFFSNVNQIIFIAGLVVVISIFFSINTSKWHWFSRSGAIVTMAGVLLTARPLFRKSRKDWIRSLIQKDYGHIVPNQEEIEEDKQQNCDNIAFRIGTIMALMGTLIWAYGDLIGGLPKC